MCQNEVLHRVKEERNTYKIKRNANWNDPKQVIEGKTEG
jgi:hypothetical protein